MECWGVRERMCALELFIRTRSISETQRGFRSEWNQQEASSPNTIRRRVRQWLEEGSVTCKKPPVRPSSVRKIAKLSDETHQTVIRSFLTRVHLWIEEGGGHLKDTVHKKWHYAKKVKRHSTLWRDTIGINYFQKKMLFLFIISSLFLPHRVQLSLWQCL